MKTNCESEGLNLNQEMGVAHFENAIHNSVVSVWIDAKFIGCRFHLFQLFRKNQNLGLTAEFKDKNNEIGKWLKHVFGYPFLNSSDGDCFVFDFLEIQPNGERVTILWKIILNCGQSTLRLYVYCTVCILTSILIARTYFPLQKLLNKQTEILRYHFTVYLIFDVLLT